MSDHQRPSAQDLIDRAAELPASERRAFLETALGQHPELRDSLHQTLDQSFDPSLGDEDSLFAPGGALRGAVFDALASELSPTREGDQIGPYRLIELMGSGGMGEVWRASQSEPVKREVAIKLIKKGMDSEEVLARFRSERQALAMMDHGNVARVFDAGVTAVGRSYFVMELIKGQSITDFCDQRRFSTVERLELFLDVCAGVEHAHKRGIIHRDLKPSNILVTLEGDVPVPKIIDFGIAKAVGGSLGGHDAATRLGQWIGTPEYMSPEQADLSTYEIDTRADVYSLGAVLYELLSGTQLFDSKALRDAGLDEMRRRIKEVEPSRPSERLSEIGDSTTQVAQLRRTVPASLARTLQGDLDWIVMKAVEKERARRYGSAHELAADIERHLRYEPVLAGPPTLRYRVSKFVRRHRLAVAASTLIALALVLGSVLATVGLVRARAAEERALLEAEKANEINRFLREILGSARPEGGLGREVSVVDALAEARRKVAASFADNPAVGADIRSVMGATYLELGLYDEARELLEESLEMQRDLGRSFDSDRASTMNELARLHHTTGNLDEAEALFREVLSINRQVYGDQDRRVAATLNNLGLLLVHRGRREEALAMLSEALELKRKLFGSVHEEVTPTLNNLGLLLADMGRYEEATRYLEDAVAVNRELHGRNHALVGINLNNLATNYSDMGDFERAEATFEECLAIKKVAFGEDHTSYGITLSNLAQSLDRQGRYEEARPLHVQALDIYRRTLEERSHRIGTGLARYGFNLFETGHYDEARMALNEGIDILEESFGSEDPRTEEAKETLAELRRETGVEANSRSAERP